MDMFEKATRSKLRFSSTRGDLTIEDVWDLSLTSKSGHLDLNKLAQGIKRELDAESQDNFVSTVTSPNKSRLELMLDIVKHVIAVKLQEQSDAKIRAEKAARKAVILQALEERTLDEIKSKSREDLLKELAEIS